MKVVFLGNLGSFNPSIQEIWGFGGRFLHQHFSAEFGSFSVILTECKAALVCSNFAKGTEMFVRPDVKFFEPMESKNV